ncbi:MAG: DUF3872 domain-containing protein [Prevotellaceae bacterium]|jgi:uncharacterized protein (DUF58 family)|nr:DUF3872 domain-containing protein [Prevotellaceae bacterium]
MWKKYTYIYLLAVLLFTATACNDELAIRTNFDFEVSVLPYYTTVSINEPVELRLEIKSSKDGSYDDTEYFMRYFQYTGKGMLVDETGTVFVPNDAYQVYKKPFRFYFTPTSGQQHQLELTFYDSFENTHILTFNFTIEEEKIEE